MSTNEKVESRKSKVESEESKGEIRTVAAFVAGVIAMLVVSLRGQQPQTPFPPPPADPGLPLQERRRADQRHGDGVGREADASSRVCGRKTSSCTKTTSRLEVTHFDAERVPVSLGIALDTSGSMAGDKIQEAQDALDRFLFELLDKQDQIFLYRFSNRPVLLQEWTRDRQLLSRALGRITPNGGTAMYDTVAEAIPLAQRGENQKKALLVISDGNDTSSATDIRDLKIQIRQSEVLVYAIGIDGEGEHRTPDAARAAAACRFRCRFPAPDEDAASTRRRPVAEAEAATPADGGAETTTP